MNGLNRLRDQFFLSQDGHLGPAGWPQRLLGPWCLKASPSLRVRDIRSTGGHVSGWLLGLAIGDGQVLDDDVWDLPTLASPAPFEVIESHLYRLGGRFLAIVFTNDGEGRVYLDAGGTLAAVFDPAKCCLASTPSLMPWSEPDDVAVQIRSVMGDQYWYPFGITSRRGISRLLPNHYLSLGSWEMCRHWTYGSTMGTLPVDTAAQVVGEVLARHMQFAAHHGGFHLPLTAGRDSRMLLACARHVQPHMACFTVRRTDHPAGPLDARTAASICRRLGIPHTILDAQPGSDQDLEDFAYQVGACVGVPRRSFHAEEFLPDTRHYMLLGAAGELARGYYARAEDDLAEAHHPELLLERAHFPLLPGLIKRAAQWRVGTGQTRWLPLLDLFYLENRVGCWASPMCYGHWLDTWFPLVHREIFKAFAAIGEEDRLSGVLPRRLIARFWPELEAFPLNEAWGWHKWRTKLARKLRSIGGKFGIHGKTSHSRGRPRK